MEVTTDHYVRSGPVLTAFDTLHFYRCTCPSTGLGGIFLQTTWVNPVDIWEGIDTNEETGRNCLTKLAIHILSIVANSAGCEPVCSKLGVEKVHKTTMVGMDIKRSHLEAGLLLREVQELDRMSFKLTAMAADHLNIDQDDSDGLTDFNQLSKCLIAGAASANFDKDIGDSDDNLNELPPAVAASVQALSGPLTITIPPLNSASLSPQASQLKRTCIPLGTLFDYLTDTDLPSEGMNTFCRGGIENLAKEMEACEILNSSEEAADGIQSEIPAMLGHVLQLHELCTTQYEL
ncbi:hypothetical protein EDB83DRAFT_2320545 [Lactarius deliciosus]|nr:hypothetical protein EDB83DRAFT_2320545 [Lactarius deliciosus]